MAKGIAQHALLFLVSINTAYAGFTMPAVPLPDAAANMGTEIGETPSTNFDYPVPDRGSKDSASDSFGYGDKDSRRFEVDLLELPAHYLSLAQSGFRRLHGEQNRFGEFYASNGSSLVGKTNSGTEPDRTLSSGRGRLISHGPVFPGNRYRHRVAAAWTARVRA